MLDQARQGYWALTDRGIYFVHTKESARASIEFLSFDTNRTTQLGAIDGDLVIWPPGFAVSPDGRWILLRQVARRESDLMLVENFR
jgi:hypothetical protein